MSLDFGTIRLKQKGGHGGHNGLRDIIQHIGDRFLRVRVGVGRPPAGWDPANFVLGKWSKQESEAMDSLVDEGVSAIEKIITEDIEAAMRQFNIRN